MRHAGPVRRELGVRTFFNLLGPLANPARREPPAARRVRPGAPRAARRGARELGTTARWVVHGEGGLDEVSPGGETRVAVLSAGRVRRARSRRATSGSSRRTSSALAGGDAAGQRADLRARCSRARRGPRRTPCSERGRGAGRRGRGAEPARGCGARGRGDRLGRGAREARGLVAAEPRGLRWITSARSSSASAARSRGAERARGCEARSCARARRARVARTRRPSARRWSTGSVGAQTARCA